jgi:hypothetical protein
MLPERCCQCMGLAIFVQLNSYAAHSDRAGSAFLEFAA